MEWREGYIGFGAGLKIVRVGGVAEYGSYVEWRRHICDGVQVVIGVDGLSCGVIGSERGRGGRRIWMRIIDAIRYCTVCFVVGSQIHLRNAIFFNSCTT